MCTASYTYLWDNAAASTTASITGLVAGTYNVTVTDANGCTKVCSSSVNEPGCALSASTTGTAVKCNGGSDGVANVAASGNIGAVTYLWNNAAASTTASISGLTAGTYNVTVTESATCKATASYVVTEPSVLAAACAKIDVTTSGGSDGAASVTASGGTASYTYLWDNAAASTTASITGLTAGTYSVTVTDANGCTKVCNSIVNEPGACTPPNAGTNQTLACSGAIAPTTATLSVASSGHTWSVISQPSGANATVDNTGAAANMILAGDYIFELKNDTNSTCKDSVRITVPTCASPCGTPNCGGTSIQKL